MHTAIVTALFDINREKFGDGRKIDEYLNWFRETLKLKSDMIIFTEEKFSKFINENRDNKYNTSVIIQKFEEIPFYHNKKIIDTIINSSYFKLKMKDINRIECYLSDYNIIQYSKFGWLKLAIEKFKSYDYFFWMDAGCSRFFDGFDLEKEWPNKSKLDVDKLTIQGNINYLKMFDLLKINEYIWDNNCILVGTLFGGGCEILLKLYKEVNNIFEFMTKLNCVNNEQFALAIFAKQNKNLINIIVQLDSTHLPLFKLIG